MKAFLVNPDYPNKHSLLFPIPPLGLAYIAAVLEREGLHVRKEDQFATGVSETVLAERILDFSPDILAIGSLTPTINTARSLVRRARDMGFRGRVMFGGVHPSLFARDLIEEGTCDMVVRGEGEQTVAETVRRLREGGDLGGVAGLSFRDEKGRVVHNPDRAQLKNLDELPFPHWDDLDFSLYDKAPLLQLRGRILPVQASRGCSQRCIFCGQEIFYPKLAFRSLESILAEIDFLVDRYGIDYFIFIDANFPWSREFGMKFCKAAQEAKWAGRVSWCCEMKVNLADPELLREMKKAGCVSVQYGFEVGDQDILRSLRKQTTLDQARKAMGWTRQAGIKTLGLFMIGLPGEGYRQIFRTFSFARDLDCDMVKFNMTIPQPGSALFEAHREELLRDFNPECFAPWYRKKGKGPDVATVPGGLGPKKLRILQTMGMLLYYARPAKALQILREPSLSKKNLAQGVRFLLGDFFRSLAP